MPVSYAGWMLMEHALVRIIIINITKVLAITIIVLYECSTRKCVAVVFFTPKFRFFILVPYFMKPGNELCTSTDIIDTLEECQDAISNLKLTLIKTKSDPNRPKGCYAWRGGTDAYWNTASSGIKHSMAHPICKKSEKIE
jgi:hypothetical protein